MNIQELNKELGNIDIYLLDQILKCRFKKSDKILDVGCGEGRNLIYFLNNGYDVFGVDRNQKAIEMLQTMARSINRKYEPERFMVWDIESMRIPENFFDVVICSAVLHFAQSTEHFHTLVDKVCNVLKPGGILFIRMTSDIGIENNIHPVGQGIYKLLDGTTRFLINENLLKEIMAKYHLEFLEPLKSVNVDHKRSMATLILTKHNGTIA
ncbi:class I SAM-dependent methyltransferase [Fulvivirgaceae bacterium BMA10]|uniref:Class I SAM-dependent methyltransferase n=1 Tax=Splendidivirga corallicola TaxID=3051826 RepID=A0ABT8KM60_9BACT|nr:class I SAM-dependent methyltransferase [Fulvivirgaceae bacterium BMA10]